MSAEPLQSAPDTNARIVGRAREQALLDAAFIELRDGHGRLVLISGEAGIGKSTLVAFAAQGAVRHGITILRGQCYDLSIAPPYGPWIELAASYRPRNGWPALPAFITDGEALAALGGQDALFRQVAGFYAELAQQQPLLIVLEDLHWADASSLALLRFLSRSLAAEPVLFLVTYRDDEQASEQPLAQLLPVLVRETDPLRLRLTRFDRDAVVLLIQSRYPLTNDDRQRLCAMLAERAEGNPFFTGELLRTLEDEVLLQPGTPCWTLGDLSRVPLPSLIRQIVERRCRPLTSETRRLLALGAMVGTTVSLDLWRQVSELSEIDFIEQLRPAIEQRLLVESSLADHLNFSHALIQAALYESVILPQRRLWHRSIAEALLTAPQYDPSLVAEHFQRAGDARTVEWLSRAGRQAQRLYAWHTAIERYEAALALVGDDESRARERGWICYRLGRVLCYRDGARSRQYLEEAQRLGATTGDERLSACTIAELGQRHALDGDYQLGLRLLAEGIDRFDRLPDDAGTPSTGQSTLPTLKRGMDELRGQYFIWYSSTVDFAVGALQVEEMLANSPESSATGGSAGVALANAYIALGMCLALLGELERAREAFAQARARYRNPFGRALTIDAEFASFNLPYFADQPDLLDREAAESLRHVTSAIDEGVVLGGIYSLASVTLSLLRGTDWDAAEQILQRGATEYPGAYWRQLAQVFLAQLAAVRGETDAAWRMIHAVLPDSPAAVPVNQPFYLSFETIACALSLAESGDLATLEAWLYCADAFIEQSLTVWIGSFLERYWSIYYQRLGDTRQAKDRAERALELARNHQQPRPRLAAHRLLGELELDAGDLAAAEAQLNEALRLSDACRAAYERAQTLLVLARLRLAQRDRDGAAALLVELRAIAQPLRAAPLLAKADALQASASALESSGPPNTLTPREIEVLQLVALGLTDVEVAERLYVSPRTISSHLSSIYGKLGVRSRTEAVHIASQQQLY